MKITFGPGINVDKLSEAEREEFMLQVMRERIKGASPLFTTEQREAAERLDRDYLFQGPAGA